MHITIGSRKSLLAQIQAREISARLRSLGATTSLSLMSTTGDQNLRNPLWQEKGKDFFTKELDSKLAHHEIDLVVHSLKDLSSDRPPGFFLTAIGEREFDDDILLIKKPTIRRLKAGEFTDRPFTVGTSSPRRIAHLQYLNDYLPWQRDDQKVTIKEKWIRGNVQTRIKQVLKNYVDALVLSLAGLERLAKDSEGKIELRALIANLDYMILPLSQFPTSPGQGALAVEINQNNPRFEQINKLCRQLNHQPTRILTENERGLFARYGGGCHLPVGISSFNHRSGKQGTFLSGLYKNRFFRERRYSLDLEKLAPNLSPEQVFIGLNDRKTLLPGIVQDEILIKSSFVKSQKIAQSDQDAIFYLTTRHAFQALKNSSDIQALFTNKRVFAAGTKSMKLLAKNRIWCSGCSDGQGDDYINRYKKSHFLNLFPNSLNRQWQVLSHDQAFSSLGPIVECYTRKIQQPTRVFQDRLKKVKAFYWTSFYQFEVYHSEFPNLLHKNSNIVHLCGLGKTYQQLYQANIPINPILGLPTELLGGTRAT
jgi:hydroxymethylbilane synthase